MNKNLKDPKNESEVQDIWDHWFNHVSATFALLLAALASAWWWIGG